MWLFNTGDKDCDLLLNSKGTLPVKACQYRAWMHAPLFSPAKKSTVVVPGFYEQRRETSRTETPGGAAFTFKPQNPPAKQSPPVVPMQKVTPESSFPIIINSILVDNSRGCDDFPLGFEVYKRKFHKTIKRA